MVQETILAIKWSQLQVSLPQIPEEFSHVNKLFPVLPSIPPSQEQGLQGAYSILRIYSPFSQIFQLFGTCAIPHRW